MRGSPLSKLLPVACGLLLLTACAEHTAIAAQAPDTDIGPIVDADIPDEQGQQLCEEGETTVFACATGSDRDVAVCASSATGLVQYREGAAGGPAEVNWPQEGTPAPQAFRSETLMYSGGGGSYLRFDREGQVWTVYIGSGRGWKQAGVVVEEAQDTVRDLVCEDEDAVRSMIGPGWFQRTGIPKDLDGFEIPVRP